MDSSSLMQFCLEKGLLVDQELLQLLSESGDPEATKIFIEKMNHRTHKRILTKTVLQQHKDTLFRVLAELPTESQPRFQSLKVKLGLTVEVTGTTTDGEELSSRHSSTMQLQEHLPLVSVVRMPPALYKKVEVKDFVQHFRHRLQKMTPILQEHPELESLTSIGRLSSDRQNVSLIGIVYSKTVTKNKNILLEVEDLTGKVKVLISQAKPELYEKAEEITLDAIIGITGMGNREIFFANDVIFPEAYLPERKHGLHEEYAAFIGDLHVGSKLFLEEEFLKFIDYLNGKLPNTPEAMKIKYLFLNGDLVAGVGIYPGQEKELHIQDIEEQYTHAAHLLSLIRKDIHIILTPGNHDAVRIMEPQPVLDEKFAWALFQLPNILLVGNPCLVNMGATAGFSGYDVLMYHGYSFHYYANTIPRLMQEKAVHKPDKIMHYLLKNRHLVPTHSSSLYFPSPDDGMLIDTIPDLFISGHTHKGEVSYYNNILVISNSSWESMTPFQEKVGNRPDFCKVPLFNLKTRAIKILDFEDYSKENNRVKV